MFVNSFFEIFSNFLFGISRNALLADSFVIVSLFILFVNCQNWKNNKIFHLFIGQNEQNHSPERIKLLLSRKNSNNRSL